jgi:hypothetical protein
VTNFLGEDLARIRVARLLRNTASHLGKRRDGGESILRCPSLRLAGMNLVCQLDQLALDPVGEIDDALHVAIADGANVIKLGRRSECPNS